MPRIGQFSSNLAGIELTTLRNEGLLLGALMAVKVVATYLQQALLWDAALGAIFKIRVDVFRKLLERDLGFFEGGKGVPAGDIAYRLTAEAADVADTLYSILNVSMLMYSLLFSEFCFLHYANIRLLAVLLWCNRLVANLVHFAHSSKK